MEFIDRLSLAWKISGRLDILDGVISNVEALNGVLERLQGLERRMPQSGLLEALAVRLEAFNSSLVKIEQPEKPKETNPVKEDLREWERLKLLSQFVHLHGKAKEIETEWQRIQQDEHDFQFAFNSSPNEETQSRFLYRKGVADGIKWCLKNFS